MIHYFEQTVRNEDAWWFSRWEPYGLAFNKQVVWQFGGRPVLYLSNEEVRELEKHGFSELWRCGRLELAHANKLVCFSHEREWRVQYGFRFCDLKGDDRPRAIVNTRPERDELLTEFSPRDPSCFISGVICLEEQALAALPC